MSPYRAPLFSIGSLACFLCVWPAGGPFAAEVKAAPAPARTDAYGDPLPPGALLRLGAVRWRACARYLAFTPDGKTIAAERESGGQGGERVIEMSLWDVALNKETRRWLLPNRTRRHLGFAPDGSMIAGAEDRAFDLWDAPTGKELPALLAAEAGSLNCLAFSQDGKTLAAAGDSGVIYLWQVGMAKVQAVLTGHRAKVTSLDFSPDGSRLISGSLDTTAIIWDLAQWRKP